MLQNRFRFSLRVLLYAALLVASIMWLVDSWPAWYLERTFGGQTKPIRAIAFSPDSRRLFAGGEDGALHSISLDDGTRWIAAGAAPHGISTISVSPDGTRVFVGGVRGSLFDVASGKKIFQLEEHRQSIASSAYAPDGAHIITGGGANELGPGSHIRIWNAKTGALVATLKGHLHSVTGLAISPDGRFVYSGSREGTIRVWNFQDAVELHKFEVEPELGLPVLEIALNPDGSQLAIIAEGDRYYVWPTAKAEKGISAAMADVDYTLKGVGSEMECLSWFPDSKRLLSSTGDQKLITSEPFAIFWKVFWPEAQPGPCVVSPNGKHVAFLTRPNTLGLLTNRRPEEWYGFAYLPAFWLTLLMAAALIRTIVAERKALTKPAEAPPA
jgi:WD40 repeat protein